MPSLRLFPHLLLVLLLVGGGPSVFAEDGPLGNRGPAALPGALDSMAKAVKKTLSGPDTLRAEDTLLQPLPPIAHQGPIKKVIVIPVEEQVDHGLLVFLRRAVDEALKQKPDALVFRINTYGGELHSAFEITDLLLGIRQCSTYAYVDQKAISAGALIALANNRLVMGKGTTIGDCAPITQSQDGMVVLGEKIQSPLRAKFRNLAERNGYPSLLAQSMVTMEMGVVAAYPKDAAADTAFYTLTQWENLSETRKKQYRDHKILLDEGELLTMTDLEARNYGFSQGSYESLDDFLRSRGWEKTAELETSWSEDLARALGRIAPLLLLVGFGALYLEFKTPGFSVFGIIGIIALVVVFGSKYAAGLANHTEVLLLLLGIAFFLAEIYVLPGTFLLGGVGLLFIIASLVMAMQPFSLPDPEMPWQMRTTAKNVAYVLGMALLALAVPLFLFKYLIPALPKGYSIVSETSLAEAKATSRESETLRSGMQGRSRTALRPFGKALFAGGTFEVKAQSGFIEEGRTLEVISVTGNTATVRELPAPEGTGGAEPARGPAAGPAGESPAGEGAAHA